jgi:polar amino acid transport system substrate-binding protein
MFKWALIFLYFSIFNSFGCQLDVRLEQFSPASQKNIQGSWSGVDMDLTKALLDEAQCNFTVLEVSWARALIMLNSGDIDLVLNVSKTIEREVDYYFIGPIHNETIVFVTYENRSAPLNTIADIFKLAKPIAIQRSAYYGKEIQKFIQQADYNESFVHVANNETKLRLLKRGRISGFLEAKRNIIHSIENDKNYEGVWFPDLVIHHNPIYFAFSKKSVNEALMLKISDSFDLLTSQGKIKQIILKHENNHLPSTIIQEK